MPFGIRNRIIRFFAHPDKIASTAFSVDFFGLTYSGDLSRFLDWEVYFYGAYEIEVLSLLDDIFNATDDPRSCFIDIGANVGQHSLFVGRRGIRIICFEPWSKVRSILERRVYSNNLKNVEILPFALGKTNCTRDFYAPSGNNTGTGSLLGDYNPGNNTIAISVQQLAGDEILRELNVNKPAVLKIDVEGSEREVLESIPHFLHSARPIVIMEISPATRASFQDSDELRSLFGPGYDLYAVARNRDRYQLTQFEFDRANGNILALPKEHAALFENQIRRT